MPLIKSSLELKMKTLSFTYKIFRGLGFCLSLNPLESSLCPSSQHLPLGILPSITPEIFDLGRRVAFHSDSEAS